MHSKPSKKFSWLLFYCLYVCIPFVYGASLDIDGDTRVHGITDGRLIQRFLTGQRGAELIADAVSPYCSRCTAETIEAALLEHIGDFDIDGNGRLEPFHDGAIIMRYLAGFRGQALEQRTGIGCSRCSAFQLSGYLDALKPTLLRLDEGEYITTLLWNGSIPDVMVADISFGNNEFLGSIVNRYHERYAIRGVVGNDGRLTFTSISSQEGGGGAASGRLDASGVIEGTYHLHDHPKWGAGGSGVFYAFPALRQATNGEAATNQYDGNYLVRLLNREGLLASQLTVNIINGVVQFDAPETGGPTAVVGFVDDQGIFTVEAQYRFGKVISGRGLVLGSMIEGTWFDGNGARYTFSGMRFSGRQAPAIDRVAAKPLPKPTNPPKSTDGSGTYDVRFHEDEAFSGVYAYPRAEADNLRAGIYWWRLQPETTHQTQTPWQRQGYLSEQDYLSAGFLEQSEDNGSVAIADTATPYCEAMSPGDGLTLIAENYGVEPMAFYANNNYPQTKQCSKHLECADGRVCLAGICHEPQAMRWDQIDLAGGRCPASDSGTKAATCFYSRQAPTIIYVHGWQPDGTKGAYFREAFNPEGSGGPDAYLIRQWLLDGWNVGSMYWNQFADEGFADWEAWDDLLGVDLAEEKIWNAQGQEGNEAFAMRWRSLGYSENGAENGGRMADVCTGSPAASEIFYQHYRSAMADHIGRLRTDGQGAEIRIAGHSLGNQMASGLLELTLAGDDPNLIPNRLSLLDPYWTRDKQDYWDDGQAKATYEHVTGILQEAKRRDVLIEAYRSSALSGAFGANNAEGLNLTAFAELTSGYFWPWDLQQKHAQAVWWYFWSYEFPPPCINCSLQYDSITQPESVAWPVQDLAGTFTAPADFELARVIAPLCREAMDGAFHVTLSAIDPAAPQPLATIAMDVANLSGRNDGANFDGRRHPGNLVLPVCDQNTPIFGALELDFSPERIQIEAGKDYQITLAGTGVRWGGAATGSAGFELWGCQEGGCEGLSAKTSGARIRQLMNMEQAFHQVEGVNTQTPGDDRFKFGSRL
jgi:hypothetical protein